MPILIKCKTCSKTFSVIPARRDSAKFCSALCKAEHQKTIPPEKHGRWLGGIREKECVGCGRIYGWSEQHKPYVTFLNQKYCSYKCSREHQKEYVLRGEIHPKWNGGVDSPRAIRARQRWSHRYVAWRNAVFQRDNYTCVVCGVRGGDLNADHIKTWSEHSELRYDVENGRTLCVPCHRKTFKFHGNQYVSIENGAKSVKHQNGQRRASKAEMPGQV
jgi:5-methylcytosine-specific restriction endonuclease McrA